MFEKSLALVICHVASGMWTLILATAARGLHDPPAPGVPWNGAPVVSGLGALPLTSLSCYASGARSHLDFHAAPLAAAVECIRLHCVLQLQLAIRNRKHLPSALFDKGTLGEMKR